MEHEGPLPDRVGEILEGKYRLERRLSVGGMGEVYRARNEVVGRAVAIKLMHPSMTKDSLFVSRFLREARAANRVRHPHVVDVLDVGHDETGTPFIVQELLEGEDLAARLARTGGALPFEDVLALLLPIIDAVAAAHARGVVHRDLKPSNVFLCESNGRVVPKLLDFGISKLAEPGFAASVTVSGTALGTPAYMSPEQIDDAKRSDARTDVWALGVMLYELLAGRLPFKGETAGILFLTISTNEPEALERVAPEVSLDVARVVDRCLRKQLDLRYFDAAELAADLRRAQRGEPIAPVSARPLPPLAAREPVGDVASVENAQVLRAAPVKSPERSSGAATLAAITLDESRPEPSAPRVQPRRVAYGLALLALVAGALGVASFGAPRARTVAAVANRAPSAAPSDAPVTAAPSVLAGEPEATATAQAPEPPPPVPSVAARAAALLVPTSHAALRVVRPGGVIERGPGVAATSARSLPSPSPPPVVVVAPSAHAAAASAPTAIARDYN